MARRSPPRKVTYIAPVPRRLARNTLIESTFEVGRRFRCTMRVDCGLIDPGAAVIQCGVSRSTVGRVVRARRPPFDTSDSGISGKGTSQAGNARPCLKK